MKRLLLLSAILSICAITAASNSFLAGFFDFLASDEQSEKNYTLLEPAPQQFEPTVDEEEAPADCSAINEDNPYLEAAIVEGDEEGVWHYDVEKAIDEFLTVQDELFSERIALFAASSQGNGCDLSDPETDEPSLQDHDIDPPEKFAYERVPELRQMDCAFEEMLRSKKLLCGSGVMPITEGYACDNEYRRWKLDFTRKQLRIAMESALMQMDEMAMAWPLHKRLECLNEKFADQREKTIDFLKEYAKLPAAFINAAQSK